MNDNEFNPASLKPTGRSAKQAEKMREQGMITTTEVSAALGITVKSVARAWREHRVAGEKVGNTIYLHIDSVIKCWGGDDPAAQNRVIRMLGLVPVTQVDSQQLGTAIARVDVTNATPDEVQRLLTGKR